MEAPRWLEPREQQAWRAYLDATRVLIRTLDDQLTRDAAISFTDFELLVVLSEAPDRRLRMNELADAVTTTRSGVTRAISRLVEAGWVVRVKCAEDGRGMSAELTDAGADKLASASPGHVNAVRENMFDQLSARDVQVIGESFQRMRTYMAPGRAVRDR